VKWEVKFVRVEFERMDEALWCLVSYPYSLGHVVN
jgi:hypothetical protein